MDSNSANSAVKKGVRLEFRGGKIMGALPMIFFIIWAITFSLLGAASESLFIVGMIIGIMLGLLVCKTKWSEYAEVLFDGMTQKIAIIAILAYFWAGMFSQILRAGGFVDGLIWLGLEANVTGGLFIVLTFVLAALFATATGTAYGTITTFIVLMLPAGVILGADPVILIGAIISGGIFGDNLAPISDTTIISATTQETDIPGVVRTRFKYAIAAAIPAMILFYIFGGKGEGPQQNAQVFADLKEQVGPEGLIFIIPFIIVLVAAFRGHHIITSLTWGIITSTVLVLIMGISFTSIIHVDLENSVIEGALINGISGYFPLSILLLFILAGSYIMEASGLMDALKNYFIKVIKGSVRRAELSIYFVSALFSVLITHNAAAGITVSSFVRDIGKQYNIHAYRRANLLDAIIASLAGVIPWGGHVLLTFATVTTLSKTYDFIPVVTPTQMVPYIFHGWMLPIVMLIAVITGWGLRFTGKQGEEVKKEVKQQVLKDNIL